MRSLIRLCLGGIVAGAMVTSLVSPANAISRPTRPGALALSSHECAANRAAGTIKYASPFGYDASAGIIDVYATLKLGYFSDLCLSVDFINVPFTESPYALVSADTAQISSEGNAADTLVAESGGTNMVGIATYGDVSDYALLTIKSITNLKQLQGKLLAYHTVLPVVLTEMLVKAGVKLSAVHMVNDVSYNPALLTEGRFQALQAYQSNEPFTLEAEGAHFREWTPAQLGVTGTFNVIVANRVFLADHTSAASDFLRAEFRAFSYCESHASQCVGFLAKAQGPTFLVSHGLQEWRFESALAASHHLVGEGIGVESRSEWASEATAVYQYHRVSKPVNVANDENTSLAASLYHGTTLIWP